MTILITQSLTDLAFAEDEASVFQKNRGEYHFGLLATLGKTTNATMPEVFGLQVSQIQDSSETYFELVKASYSEKQLFSPSIVSGETVEQKSKFIATVGLKGFLVEHITWDVGLGLNSFTYSTSGTDLTCCVNTQYQRSYDFNGLFIRPSLGLELSMKSWKVGIRLLSWMQYLAKDTQNLNERAPDNPYITSTLDSFDDDGIQSSHQIPPHAYFNFSF